MVSTFLSHIAGRNMASILGVCHILQIIMCNSIYQQDLRNKLNVFYKSLSFCDLLPAGFVHRHYFNIYIAVMKNISNKHGFLIRQIADICNV